jgi:hypothetical protein
MSTLPATIPPAQQARPPAPQSKLIVQDESPIAYIMDTARFEHSNRIAKMMAFCQFMPDHLVMGRDKKPLPEVNAIANCMLVLGQAMRWQMDPYNVAGETYVVSGKLSYQGKLIAAVVNARGKLAAPLDVIYSSGKGDNLAAVVYGSKSIIPAAAKDLFKKYANDEDYDALTDLKFMGVMAIRVTVGQCKTNNQMWTKDPSQKLFYTGAAKWARRFCPELMLGVLTDEDFERMATGDTLPSLPQQPGEQLRTLDEITSKVSPVATVALPQPEPEAKPEVIDEQGEVIDVQPSEPAKQFPEWMQARLNEIAEAKKYSILSPIGNDLIREYRSPELNDADRDLCYPTLFTEWTKAAFRLCPASGKPQLVAIIEGWKQYLPASITEALAELT